MKKYLFAALVLGLAACSNAPQQPESKNKNLLSPDLVHDPHTAGGTDTAMLGKLPTLDLQDTTHDFGTIHEGEVVTQEFSFKNNGKSPLIIGSATGSCGCTVADFPHDPILPGKGGVLKVMFNSKGKEGHQEKTVTVNTNTARGTHMIFIKAEVKPEGK
ncbi:DUF1573 domain-containing protein [Chitinophagaceae bacterium MMS25-I14]